MSKQTVSGPYQVTLDDVERSSTLDGIDIGSWYIIINGAMQFCESEMAGHQMKAMLQKLI